MSDIVTRFNQLTQENANLRSRLASAEKKRNEAREQRDQALTANIDLLSIIDAERETCARLDRGRENGE